MKQVSPLELQNWRSESENVTLIDIREKYEFDFSNIGALSIPMAEILDRLDEIPNSGKVVLHCRTGKRAEAMIDYLETNHHYSNLYNLTGGILAWSEEVDASVTPC